MKKETTKRAAQKDDIWVDVHNDTVMREMGIIRPLLQEDRDPEVWTKTPYERQALKKAKNSCKKKDMHFHTIPRRVSQVRGKLIITLLKNKVFDKTTFSTECWEHEIPNILAMYQAPNKKTGYIMSIIKKYSWNGRTFCNLSSRG